MKTNNNNQFKFREVGIPSCEYCKTLQLKEGLFDFGIPLVIAIFTIVLLINTDDFSIAALDFIKASINLLAILVGFNITCIVILLTSNSQNIVMLKDFKCFDRKHLNKKNVTLFQLLFMNFTHVLVIQMFLLIANIVFIIAQDFLINNVLLILTGFDLYVLLHVLLVLIRNMGHMYMSFWNN